MGTSVQIPRITRLRRDLRDVHLVNLLGHFQKINVQARGHVPRDVAMERPDPGIISVEFDNDVRRRGRVDGAGKHLHVTALRVGRVDDIPVPSVVADLEDAHVVAVDVHGVGDVDDAVVDDEADRLVGAEVVDVPFGLVAEVSRVGLVEEGVVVVAAEAGAVHVPDEVPRGILAKGDVDDLGVDIRSGCLRHVWVRKGDVVVLTGWIPGDWLWNAGWQCGGVGTFVEDDGVNLGNIYARARTIGTRTHII